MTQRELARALDMSPAVVTNWVKGEHAPKQSSLEKIVDALGLSMVEFYGRVPKAKRVA